MNYQNIKNKYLYLADKTEKLLENSELKKLFIINILSSKIDKFTLSEIKLLRETLLGFSDKNDLLIVILENELNFKRDSIVNNQSTQSFVRHGVYKPYPGHTESWDIIFKIFKFNFIV